MAKTDTDVRVELVKTNKSLLSTTEVSNGCVYFVEDTKELFFDFDSKRSEVKDILVLQKEAERTSILFAPLNKFYFVLETQTLWFYKDGTWYQVSQDLTNYYTKEELNNLINKFLQYVSITYADLVALKNANELVEGTYYKITDYVTTTNGKSPNTSEPSRSAGHQFDIVVRATSTSTLSELASASLHEGDTYFATQNVGAWQIWYDINNDTTKYNWAVTDGTGRGVIYRMIDERQNDLPYDFKNIQFYRDKTLDKYSLVSANMVLSDGYYFTFHYLKDSNNSDNSLLGNCYNNTILKYAENHIALLNNIVILNKASTGCSYNTFGSNSYNNTMGSNYSFNELGNLSYNNVVADGFYLNSMGNFFFGNTINTNCARNRCGDSFYNNTVGINFQDNTMEHIFKGNTIGSNMIYNTIGNNFSDNSIGDNFRSNNIGASFNTNTIGNDCQENDIQGAYFYHNIINNDFWDNTIGASCSYNTFGPEFVYNTLGQSITHNIFGAYMYYNTVDDYVKYLKTPEGHSGSPNVYGIRFTNIKRGVCGSSSNIIDLSGAISTLNTLFNKTVELTSDKNVVILQETSEGYKTGLRRKSSETSWTSFTSKPQITKVTYNASTKNLTLS